MAHPQRNELYTPTAPGLAPPLTVARLGPGRFENVYAEPEPFVDGLSTLVSAIKVDDVLLNNAEVELAGPMRDLFFDPPRTKVGIVTCGGLCPGLNNVIRGLVMNLHNRYKVKEIVGLKFGFEGLVASTSQQIVLTPDNVNDIHQKGGTILGSSRGEQDVDSMAQFLIDNGFDILFTIGGDGTLRGANALAAALSRRKAPISIVGIPKTIDNDICYTDATFGFETAVGLAQDAINAVHYEAKSAKNGIGIVRLMGRDAGFIALYASAANGDVNLVLIPEVEPTPDEILDFVTRRLAKKGHIVIVVAEGALQHLRPHEVPVARDRSGNTVYWDAVRWLKDFLRTGLAARKVEHTIKFVDPSYMIRSAPCCASDAHFCLCLANAAAHAAMSGKTGLVVCHHQNTFVSIPIARAIFFKKQVNPHGPLFSLIQAIEQEF